MARDPLAAPGPLLDRVYAYVAYRLGAGDLAEDVTADAFERALRYRSTYEPSRGTPEAWVIGIARRCIADLASVPITEELAEQDGGSSRFDEATDRRLDLADALAHLGDRDRELIALRYGADLDSKTISRFLDTAPGAVDVALHRALARLRSLMGE